VHRAEGGCGGHTTQREALQAATSAKGASLGPAAVEMHSGSVETASTTRVTAEGHDAGGGARSSFNWRQFIDDEAEQSDDGIDGDDGDGDDEVSVLAFALLHCCM
jgi:hypothetical protein